MEDFNGLEPRLQALEEFTNGLRAEREKQAQEQELQQLLDSYGMQFNGRRDVGMEILNQLHRRGVDTSAASSNAVQDIITDMQAQIAQLYDDFNQKRQEMDQIQQQAAQLTDQINNIDQVVADTTGDGSEIPVPTNMSSEQVPAKETLDATMTPPPAADESVTPPPADGSVPPEQPAPDTTSEVPPPVPEQPVVSDVRLKNVDTPNHMQNKQQFFIKKTNKVNVAPSADILSDKRVKEVHTPTFGRHLISVASRGF